MLTAIHRIPCTVNGKNRDRWMCRCECGVKKSISRDALIGGQMSCGCIKKLSNKWNNCTHAGTGTKLHFVWLGIRQRTIWKAKCREKYYWGKGVSLCDEWMDFVNFREWSMRSGYREGLQIDRIDPNGNYAPENCRWVTRSVNQNNRRTSRRYDFCGKSLTKAEASREFKIPLRVIHYRMGALKLTASEAADTALKYAKHGQAVFGWQQNVTHGLRLDVIASGADLPVIDV